MGKLLYSVVLGFCRTTTGIGHNYVYNPSLLSAPPPIHPSRSSVPGGAPCATERLPASYLFDT